MEWICGVTSGPQGYSLLTINGDEEEKSRPISELQIVLASPGKPTKIRGTTSFSGWRQLSPQETSSLAQELGFPQGPSGQAFYTFNTGGQRYIIPAGVLMCAMFRPFHGIAKYLFAPQGLDNLCIPYGNTEKPELLFFSYQRNSTGIQEAKAQGILNSLSWMHCFPSARKMWCSALENAIQGQLNVQLPLGEAKFSGAAQALPSGRLLIRELHIQLLGTTEKPFPQYSKHCNTIEFERILHKADKRLKVLGIPLRNGEAAMTEAEWATMKDAMIIRKPGKRGQNMLRNLNIVLKKLSEGLSWYEVSTCSKSLADSCYLYRKMKTDGRWEYLLARLTELRCAT